MEATPAENEAELPPVLPPPPPPPPAISGDGIDTVSNPDALDSLLAGLGPVPTTTGVPAPVAPVDAAAPGPVAAEPLPEAAEIVAEVPAAEVPAAAPAPAAVDPTGTLHAAGAAGTEGLAATCPMLSFLLRLHACAREAHQGSWSGCSAHCGRVSSSILWGHAVMTESLPLGGLAGRPAIKVMHCTPASACDIKISSLCQPHLACVQRLRLGSQQTFWLLSQERRLRQPPKVCCHIPCWSRLCLGPSPFCRVQQVARTEQLHEAAVRAIGPTIDLSIDR